VINFAVQQREKRKDLRANGNYDGNTAKFMQIRPIS
jgi:hypothetical protein